MEMAFAAFDQIISILPRSVETYYIFGHWLEEKNLLLSAITQQRTALLIQAGGLYFSHIRTGHVSRRHSIFSAFRLGPAELLVGSRTSNSVGPIRNTYNMESLLVTCITFMYNLYSIKLRKD